MFLKIGVITVGPVTIIKAENRNEISQLNPKIKCTVIAAPKNVMSDPNVISLVITGPIFLISLNLNVRPPSNKIILMASDTK